MVSNVNNKSIFDFEERLKFIGIDFSSNDKNIFQIAKKVKEVSGNINFNGIYDLHDVIRSKILCFLLSTKTRSHWQLYCVLRVIAISISIITYIE